MGCVAVCKAIGNNIGDQARRKAIAFCTYVRVFVHSSRCTRLVLCIEVLRLILSLLEASHAPALLGRYVVDKRFGNNRGNDQRESCRFLL